MYVIDASVWVNSFDHHEVGSNYSRMFLEYVAQQNVSILVPTLALVEVAAAISRAKHQSGLAQQFANAMSQLPTLTLVDLDIFLTQKAVVLATQFNLRGADAIYATVAQEYNSTLVTLDKEHLTRLPSVIPTYTPEQILQTIQSTNEE